LAKKSSTDQLRLRVFAGPNGSGKSTIIKSVRNTVINNKKIDFGVYINADDIAYALQKDKFSFYQYKVHPLKKDLLHFAEHSGLLTTIFNINWLKVSLTIRGKSLLLKNKVYYQEVAQLLARYLRECMLRDKRRFSFETVFSHSSNLDIMQRASEAGYKVYLYFVSTESPEINKFRVQFRVSQKGHDVPEEKIESRYYRSLELLYAAAAIAYQCFFFDNSVDDEPFKLVNHCKTHGMQKVWDTKKTRNFTSWFKKYYWDKIKH
jgi:predicted ABC-type ATPase